MNPYRQPQNIKIETFVVEDPFPPYIVSLYTHLLNMGFYNVHFDDKGIINFTCDIEDIEAAEMIENHVKDSGYSINLIKYWSPLFLDFANRDTSLTRLRLEIKGKIFKNGSY